MEAGRRFRTHLRARLIEGLVLAYGRFSSAGLMRRPRIRRLVEGGYLVYKRLVEAGPVSPLEQLIERGTTVVDAGANVGFFSVRFGRWVGPAGRVIAIEPATANLRSLRERTTRAGLQEVVECVAAVAVDFEGDARLELNPENPTDHRLGETGEPVAAVTIDSLVDGDRRRVALIKIDVQGAEAMVLAGAGRTIARHRPALFLEIDDRTLRRFDSSASDLVDSLTSLGYVPHRLTRSGIGPPVTREELLASSAAGQSDTLFLFAG